MKLQRHAQQGVAFVALLTLIGVMVAVSVAAARLRNAAETGAQVERLRDDLLQQVRLIQAKLVDCMVNFPGGDNGTGHRVAYPAAATTKAVTALTCPGAPAAQQALWGGTDAVMPPVEMVDFQPWQFTNDATSMRLSITARNSYAPTTAAMTNVALRLGTSASINGTTLTVVLSH